MDVYAFIRLHTYFRLSGQESCDSGPGVGFSFNCELFAVMSFTGEDFDSIAYNTTLIKIHPTTQKAANTYI